MGASAEIIAFSTSKVRNMLNPDLFYREKSNKNYELHVFTGEVRGAYIV